MDDLKLLADVCSIPTAPFCEDHVYAYVERFVRARKKLRLSADRFGNRLVVLPGTRPREPRLVYVAHTDHPGFLAGRMVDHQTLEARFHGGVTATFAEKAAVRFFDGDAEIAARVIAVQADEAGRLSGATLRVNEFVSAGAPGMFDQGVGRVKSGRFYSRVCDDLAGVASALAAVDALHRKPPVATVAVLLTRAEEEGFIGAIAAALTMKLLKKTDRIVSIECSAEQTYARQGDGLILRVGDRTSIFHSAFSRFLHGTAEKLAKKDAAFKFQRALMPGGTCEATVFDAWGFTAAAACVPLGNYHNMDKAAGKIGPEHVNVTDWQNMVKLFIAAGRNIHTFDGTHAPLTMRLTKRFEEFSSLL